MSLADLPPLLREDPVLLEVLGRRHAALAVPEAARSLVTAGLSVCSTRRPLLAAVATTSEADRLSRELVAYLGDATVESFPAWETLPFERVSPGVETMGRRLRVLWRLRNPQYAPAVVVAPIRALVQRLGPHVEDVAPVFVRRGNEYDPVQLAERLVAMGYRREYQVEHRGEVAVRGSIIDVFPSTAERPLRLDFWGDELDRLAEFSVADQRATTDVEVTAVFPARELLPTDEVRATAAQLLEAAPWGREHWERFAEGMAFDGMESWLPWLAPAEHLLVDLLGPDAQVLVFEPARVRDRAADLLAEEADLAGTLARTWGARPEQATAAPAVAGTPAAGSTAPPTGDATGSAGGETSAADATAAAMGDDGFPRLHLPYDRLLAHTEAPAWTVTSVPEGPEVAHVTALGWDPVVGDGDTLTARLDGLLADGYRLVVTADSEASAPRVHRLLGERGLDLVLDVAGTTAPTPGAGVVRAAALERGCILPALKLAVLAEADLTGRRRAHRPPRPRRRADSERFFEDLSTGDYVVHHTHGVGRYEGMVTRTIGGAERDYLLLAYKGGDKLYVPSDQIDTVRHYTGGEQPTLHRLGGSDFARTKAKVRSAVAEVAQELVVLYQQRVTAEGTAFAPDTPWQAEMESAFGYVETPDQARAIEEVKADMERDHPMDRLVCGDVGFGKTEVAIRAAFKAIQDGYQVAVLVPTTLLAQQHFQTFAERLAPYPVRVEVLSRFLTAAQARRVATALAHGEVDLVIGTHRLLSEDISFKRLGLLVIDEEQRFGVQHKERIKAMKAGVDVLTLTATPIPRTMEMSLTGIRDFTVINTPPVDRQPILTYVGPYDERAAAEAIRRELLRDGQVFFVHNRVHDIEKVAAEVVDLVPEARVALAHGQMDEGTLEQVVLDFAEGRYDVLVCTTIIESGIDMPTVNTLVVDRADLLGLGQLHQLRGRVGRSGQRAYAYLFHPPDVALSEQAYERLKTIGETTELGSGFKIAMRDLEIRGAGNLLGTGQSGHIAAVGYDLYCQMVTEAVADLKGEPVPEPAEIKLDLPLDASLPPDYVAREDLRLEAYRRLAAVTTPGEVDDIANEWLDRYGPLPEEAEALLRIGRLRAECARVGVRNVTVTKGPAFGGPAFTARLLPLTLATSKAIRLQRLFPKAILKDTPAATDAGGQELIVPLAAGSDPAEALVELLGALLPRGE
jgi:transcription-repair coupling factor (superfamily II helicase)